MDEAKSAELRDLLISVLGSLLVWPLMLLAAAWTCGLWSLWASQGVAEPTACWVVAVPGGVAIGSTLCLAASGTRPFWHNIVTAGCQACSVWVFGVAMPTYLLANTWRSAYVWQTLACAEATVVASSAFVVIARKAVVRRLAALPSDHR